MNLWEESQMEKGNTRYFAVFTAPSLADPAWIEFAAEVLEGKIIKRFTNFNKIRALLDELENRHDHSYAAD